MGLIARGKALGFTLAEIGALLGEGSATAATSAEEVRRAAAAKIDVVDEQVRQLADVRARLERLVATCDEGDAEGCASLATPCR
ncbi:MerR family DNA-binding protein [Iamia majanohamensis]|uniref:MerR family DNA-binding protein n=1 Tax=Iamia majanohamensis TaxID=467976 RepID=UPI003AF30202